MIRAATINDVVALLKMMRSLAETEGYLDRFAVTTEELVDRGFSHRDPQFVAFVADEGILLGYTVCYSIPFTLDLRPTIVLKELFVDEAARGRNIGRALFDTVTEYAISQNARLLRGQVLQSNTDAKRFYRSRGGTRDSEWENWLLDIETL